MFGGQEPQPLLTCTAEDPVFNYWLEHLGDWTHGNVLHGRDGRPSYNWNKTLSVMSDKAFFNFVCEGGVGGVGVRKHFNVQ